MDVTGKRFDRMSAARKSLLHIQHSLTPTEEIETGEDTVKRRSRSRKPRGKRRNTIAGTDQKEIEEVVGNVLVYFYYKLFLTVPELNGVFLKVYLSFNFKIYGHNYHFC